MPKESMSCASAGDTSQTGRAGSSSVVVVSAGAAREVLSVRGGRHALVAAARSAVEVAVCARGVGSEAARD